MVDLLLIQIKPENGDSGMANCKDKGRPTYPSPTTEIFENYTHDSAFSKDFEDVTFSKN